MRFFPATALLLAACHQPVDQVQAAQVLLARDRAWAKVAAAGANVDSILSYWTADARVALPDQPLLIGQKALRTMVSGSLATPGFHISWTPDSAIVSAAGDLGYTFGTNHVTAPDAAGHLTSSEGRYVTVWRKEADGQWRCAVDIYNLGPSASATAQ